MCRVPPSAKLVGRLGGRLMAASRFSLNRDRWIHIQARFIRLPRQLPRRRFSAIAIKLTAQPGDSCLAGRLRAWELDAPSGNSRHPPASAQFRVDSLLRHWHRCCAPGSVSTQRQAEWYPLRESEVGLLKSGY